MKIKNIILIICGILAAAAVLCLVLTHKNEPEAAAQTPAPNTPETAQTVEELSEIYNAEIGTDTSAVSPEDIEAAAAEFVAVDSQRHAIITKPDGSSVDAGYIGGEAQADTFTVVFVDWDYSLISAQIVKNGESAQTPSEPVRTGYQFCGWEGDYSSVTADTVICAKYAAVNLYPSVTFLGFEGEVLRREMVKAGGSASAPVPKEIEGYIFAGWDADFSCVTETMTVSAKYISADLARFEVSSVIASAGDGNIAVTVKLVNNPGICAAKLSVIVPEGLKLEKIDTNTSQLGGSYVGPKSLPANGSVSFIWYMYDKDFSGDCVFATLYFSSDSSGSGIKTVKVLPDMENIVNFDGNDVAFETVDGYVSFRAE